MSKKDLQRVIRKEGAFILNNGTLNMEHLLPKVHDLIVNFKLRDVYELLPSIRECFDIRRPDVVKAGNMCGEQYYGRLRMRDYQADFIYIVWVDICHFFNEIAPKGYYFGSHEGDDACIGWFLDSYEEEE